MEALNQGWDGDPNTCGADAKKIMNKMSFVGKKTCKSLVNLLKNKLDCFEGFGGWKKGSMWLKKM